MRQTKTLDRFPVQLNRKTASVRIARRGTRLTFAFGLLAFGFCTSEVFAGPTPCRSISLEGSGYTVCEVDLRRHAVRLFCRKPDGAPYGYLAALPPAQRSCRLVFAMNAGMYDPGYRPVGRYVENGRELVRANTRAGPGN